MKILRLKLDGPVNCKDCDPTILCEHCNDTGTVVCTECRVKPATHLNLIFRGKAEARPVHKYLCTVCAVVSEVAA